MSHIPLVERLWCQNLLSSNTFVVKFVVNKVLSRCIPINVIDCPFLVARKHSITQVIDLLEGLRCLALPLLCERIIEVPLRDWMVAPALQKDGRYCVRKPPVLRGDEQQQEEEEAAVLSSDEGDVKSDEGNGTFASIHAKCLESTLNSPETTAPGRPSFGSVPYIARPHPEQMSHTGEILIYVFTVRLSVNCNNLDLLLHSQHSWSN